MQMEPQNQNQLFSSLRQHIPDSPIMTANKRASTNLDYAVEYEFQHASNLDPQMDKKRLRRIISNRLSAYRARARKAKEADELEKMIKHLQGMVSVLTSRIQSSYENRQQLKVQNDSLKKLLLIRLEEARLSQLRLEMNQLELATLKELGNKSGIRCSDGVVQQMQGYLISKQWISQQYSASIRLSENGLQKPVAGSEIAATMPPNSGSAQPEKDQLGEEEVDQYLNLEG